MASTFFAPVAQGTGSGAEGPPGDPFQNAKAWSAANFATAYAAATSGGGEATGQIAFLNEIGGVGCRYVITGATSPLSQIAKVLLIRGLKSDGTEPVPDVDFLPVFYGSGLQERTHPWPPDARSGGPTPPQHGGNVFRFNQNGAGSVFRGLAFNNINVAFLMQGSSETAQCGIEIENIRASNVRAVLMTDSKNDGRFHDGTVREVRALGHAEGVVRVFPSGTEVFDRLVSDGQCQWSGGSSGSSTLQIMKGQPTSSVDRNMLITTQGTDVVLGDFLATDSGAGVSDSRSFQVTVSTGSIVVTGSGFVAEDVGATIARARIPGGTTIVSVTPGVSAVMSAAATAGTNPTAGATITKPGLGNNTVIDEVVPGVSAKLKDADTLAPVTASTSDTGMRRIWEHDYVDQAVQSNVTITTLVGIRCSGVSPVDLDAYPQGDAVIAEVSIHPDSTMSIDGIYTKECADRGIDTKRDCPVRNHQSYRDYIAIAQHRTKITVEVDPIVYRGVVMTTEDFFYKEAWGGERDRPNACFFQASGALAGHRGHMEQVVNNDTTKRVIVASTNTNNGPPVDVGDCVLSGGCQIVVGDEVVLISESGGATADLGDSTVVVV